MMIPGRGGRLPLLHSPHTSPQVAGLPFCQCHRKTHSKKPALLKGRAASTCRAQPSSIMSQRIKHHILKELNKCTKILEQVC